MEEDWRLNGQEEYLLGEKLLKIVFYHTNGSDHVHCDFCWAKFSEHEGDLREGYATFDGEHSVCEECFHDFREKFRWEIDGRIKDFDDFRQKFELYRYRKVIGYYMTSLPEEKECELCHKALRSDGTDEYCVATEDNQHWFCKTCTDDFGPIFNWEGKRE